MERLDKAAAAGCVSSLYRHRSACVLFSKQSGFRALTGSCYRRRVNWYDDGNYGWRN